MKVVVKMIDMMTTTLIIWWTSRVEVRHGGSG